MEDAQDLFIQWFDDLDSEAYVDSEETKNRDLCEAVMAGRASLLADAQRQLAIGRDSDVVLALLGEHEPLLAQELREITNA